MAKLLYYFPLDNLLNKDIINNYKTQVQMSVENNIIEVDFDQHKGSFLNFKDKSTLELTFKKTISRAGNLINFFFNYDKKNNNDSISIIAIGNEILSVIKSNNRNAIAFKNSFKVNDADFKIKENTWFNCSIYFDEFDNLEIFMTDKNFLLNNKVLISVNNPIDHQNIMIGNNKEGDKLRIADLSVYSDVTKDEAENIINKSIEKHLTLLSKSTLLDTITFKITNSTEYDKVVIENEQQPLFFEFFHKDMALDKHENCVATLKVKKGFFEYYKNIEESDDLSIPLNLKNLQNNNSNLKTIVEGVSIVNRLEQERVLVQLEIYNLTLTKDEFSTTFTKSKPLIIDKVFEVIDLRGGNVCPFEVFILGNDTLNNGVGNNTQTINLLVNNTSDEDLILSDKSGFRITGNFLMILQSDVQQTNNLKLKQYISATDIPTRPKSSENDFLYFQKEYVLKKGESLFLEISELKAKQPTSANPSGTYPFYLEYKNISGYRNGKAKFYIKTGKIFYSL
ncbi:hypothetical protein IX39_00020 [Chryseobacterium formosense]|uniref:Uncharacterized protein n=1 Tax=Chryseobacterium formosense TaxID=236814 RepID=A0A085Z3V7_9FLAO|nr:hypothetical protein [Chryseobacterium formosense]KFE99120.1 hypothetical protein IX39_00020 [Chryseobacterium formosense]SFT68577.1 hypothetical protein SAMN05421857_2424 [Chryseobacterium formosense]